jgi:hypothetical protein
VRARYPTITDDSYFNFFHEPCIKFRLLKA